MNVDVCSYPTLLSLLCYRARSVPSLTLRSMYLRSVADPGRDRDRAAPPPPPPLRPGSCFRLSFCERALRGKLSATEVAFPSVCLFV